MKIGGYLPCNRVLKTQTIKSSHNDLQSHHEPNKGVDGAFKKILEQEIEKLENEEK